MEANCIGCHNNDTNSTKRDWKVGEVGGVLEIIRPLDRDIARTREGLRGTFVLMAAVSGTLLAFSGLVLVVQVAAAQMIAMRESPGEKSCNGLALGSNVVKVVATVAWRRAPDEMSCSCLIDLVSADALRRGE